MLDHYMSTNEWKMFNHQKKLDKVYEQNRYHCECGHSVVIRPKEDRVLCSQCGNWVYKSEDLRKEYNFRAEFRKWQRLAKETENDIKTRGGNVGTRSNSKNRKRTR